MDLYNLVTFLQHHPILKLPWSVGIKGVKKVDPDEVQRYNIVAGCEELMDCGDHEIYRRWRNATNRLPIKFASFFLFGTVQIYNVKCSCLLQACQILENNLHNIFEPPVEVQAAPLETPPSPKPRKTPAKKRKDKDKESSTEVDWEATLVHLDQLSKLPWQSADPKQITIAEFDDMPPPGIMRSQISSDEGTFNEEQRAQHALAVPSAMRIESIEMAGPIPEVPEFRQIQVQADVHATLEGQELIHPTPRSEATPKRTRIPREISYPEPEIQVVATEPPRKDVQPIQSSEESVIKVPPRQYEGTKRKAPRELLLLRRKNRRRMKPLIQDEELIDLMLPEVPKYRFLVEKCDFSYFINKFLMTGLPSDDTLGRPSPRRSGSAKRSSPFIEVPQISATDSAIEHPSKRIKMSASPEVTPAITTRPTAETVDIPEIVPLAIENIAEIRLDEPVYEFPQFTEGSLQDQIVNKLDAYGRRCKIDEVSQLPVNKKNIVEAYSKILELVKRKLVRLVKDDNNKLQFIERV